MKLGAVMLIHSVVACCKNGGIGLNGGLPWKLEKELSYFQRLIRGSPPAGKKNVIIAGRKTWGSHVSGCHNIILSKTLRENRDGMDAVVDSLDSLIDLLESEEWKSKTHHVFNIGGSEIYKLIQDSPFCGRVYLTRINADYEADTFFPELNEDQFRLLDEYPPDMADEIPKGTQVDNGIEWRVEVYEKRESIA